MAVSLYQLFIYTSSATLRFLHVRLCIDSVCAHMYTYVPHLSLQRLYVDIYLTPVFSTSTVAAPLHLTYTCVSTTYTCLCIACSAPSASTSDTYSAICICLDHPHVNLYISSFCACTIVNTSVTYADTHHLHFYTCAYLSPSTSASLLPPHLWILCVHIYITYICIYMHLYLHFLWL